MFARVAASTSTLSTPMPKRAITLQCLSCWMTSAETWAYVTSNPSASRAVAKIACGVAASASLICARSSDSACLVGSRLGKTESVTTTNGTATGLPHRLFHVFHLRENDWSLFRDQHILFQSRGLLQSGMPGKGLNRKVHVLFDLGGVVERIGTRHPHTFVERESDAVSKLLEGDCAILVVVVLGKWTDNVGGGFAGPQIFNARVHRIIDFAVQINLFLGHLAGDFEAAHKVNEIARRAHGIDVDDDQVTLADDLVGCPATVRAGVAARGDDDVINDLAAAFQHELMDFGIYLALTHARLEPFVLDAPHGGIADASGLLEQFDFIARLDDARGRHGRPTIHNFETLFLERLQRRHVKVVNPNWFFAQAVLVQHLNDRVHHFFGHHGYRALSPLPSHRRANASLHPGQVNDRALKIGTGCLEENWLAAIRQHGVADVDVVFPIPLVRAGDVADIGARKENQGAQVALGHLISGALQTILAQALKVDAILPIRAGLTVHASWIPFVRLADETCVHKRLL